MSAGSMKLCRSCGKNVPLIDFYIRKSGQRFGRPLSQCKACMVAHKRRWSKNNRVAEAESKRIAKLKMKEENGEAYRRHKEYNAEWNNEHKESRGERARVYAFKKFGYTRGDYDRMLNEQGGKCAICGMSEQDHGMALNVDHCDERGIIRGLLCGHCNRAIGLFRHNTGVLHSAIKYLAGDCP